MRIRSLTYDQIQRSPEIQQWLAQFGAERTIAAELLMRLRFVSRDYYSEWLKKKILSEATGKTALYAVRKIPKSVDVVWNDEGRYLDRPAASQGSEDLVQSIIANLVKNNDGTLFDHPDMTVIKEEGIPTVILLDDSIGSGERVRSFVRRMMDDKRFKSRWSFGKIRLVVISFARMLEAETHIKSGLAGSNHGLRKFPASSKLRLTSHLAVPRDNLSQRWGPAYQRILDLCDAQTGIKKDRRRGYGNTMANLVFYHSVPNNLPGVLWFQSDRWDALFPKRTLPSWLPELLEGTPPRMQSKPAINESPNDEMSTLLLHVRGGIRDEKTLAWKLGLDGKVTTDLMLRLRGMGLVTARNRITEAGRRSLVLRRPRHTAQCNRDLYVPQSWCAGRETVQPSGLVHESDQYQAESGDGLLPLDGEVGEASLERTDAKTAPPSLVVMTENPSSARDGHDNHGPKG